MADFATMAEAIAHAMRTGEPASFTERHIPDAAHLAEVERLRLKRVRAWAEVADVWLD